MGDLEFESIFLQRESGANRLSAPNTTDDYQQTFWGIIDEHLAAALLLGRYSGFRPHFLYLPTPGLRVHL
jgi:hypothetical protein